MASKASMAAAKTTLEALYKANQGMLRQKLDLMNVMKSELGHQAAKNGYSQVCSIVGATMGQHVRHSMDHIEHAANMAVNSMNPLYDKPKEIHYDLRERGGSDEHDMDAAEERILRVAQLLRDQEAQQEVDSAVTPHPDGVDVFFMLSGDPTEFRLPSTIERELGFAVHHAIHHMAMVNIVALQTLQLPPDLLPSDFGKAPSTIVHDNQVDGN